MRTIKAAFFDIDGTLVSFKTKSIPASAVRAIEYLRNKGIKVIVPTGRSITAIDHVKHLLFDGFICFNGGCCATHDGEILFRQTINPEDIQQLLHYGSKHALHYALMYEHGAKISAAAPEIVEMHEHVNLPLPPLIDLDNVDLHNVLQSNIFLAPEYEEAFMQQVMPNCVATRWTTLFADVNPKGQGKETGVAFFCDYFGIDIADTISFGDGGNDITMLKSTGIGVAMGNANPNVKEIADYVTDDVDNDGIWKAIEYFGV